MGSGALTINSGSLGVTGGGSLTVNNNIVWNGNLSGPNNGGSLTLSGDVSLTASRTLSLVNSSITIGTLGAAGGVISDSGGSNFGLTFSGATVSGNLTLNGTNTFDGGVTLAGSGAGIRLNIGNLGSTSAGSAIGTGTFTIGTSGNVTALSFNNTSGAAGTLSTNNAQVWNGDFTFVGTNSLDMGTGAISLGTLTGATRTVTVTASTLSEGGIISQWHGWNNTDGQPDQGGRGHALALRREYLHWHNDGQRWYTPSR